MAQASASVTKHSVVLQGRTLNFTVTAEALPLHNDKGALNGEVAVVAYTLDGSEAIKRPVLFAMNGGPGSASAWLHLGLLGPWRLPMSGDGLSPSASALAKPNEETWLDFTDLVFIDPIGTGFSRPMGSEEEAGKGFYSVDGDVNALSVVIREWLVKSNRILSPKFLMGESYAGLRGPKIAKTLQSEQGVGLNGLFLVSPVLDYATLSGARHNQVSWISSLPSYAATALDAKGGLSQQALDEVEAYAGSEYLLDLYRGEADAAALDRMAKRVSAYTGLAPTLVRRLAARIDTQTFLRERNRDKGLIGSRYDATVEGADPSPNAAFSFGFSPPLTGALDAPFTSAMLDLYARFKWQPERKYELFSAAVNRKWNWGNRLAPPQSLSDLQSVLALDPNFKVLLSHGYSDLATPYFGSKLLLKQLPPAGKPDRVKLITYPGGHMYYSRDASRIAYRKEAEAIVRESAK